MAQLIVDGYDDEGLQLVEPNCEQCPLRGRKQVGWKGYLDSAFVIVGQSPGGNEVREGRPFIGESGKVLHSIIPEADNIFVTNALRCMPPQRIRKEQKLMQQAVKCCQARLQSELAAYPRKLILSLGNEALWSITGDFTTKITQIRGTLLPYKKLNGIDIELGIMPALHPAALLRGSGSWRQFKTDLIRAERLASDQEEIPVQPPIEFINVEEDWEEWEVQEIIDELALEPELTCDLETATLDPKGPPVITRHFPFPDNILLIGITSTDGRGIKYHFLTKWLQLLKPLFESTQIKWNWQNGKFDVGFLWEHGIRARVDEDTILMSYALDENPGVHDLDTIGADYLGTPLHKPMLDQWLPNKKASYATIPRNILCNYLAYDLDKTARVRDILKARVEDDPNSSKLYHKVLLPASVFLNHLEQSGFTVDPRRVSENTAYYQEELAKINAEAAQLLNGQIVNLASPPQMKVVLFKQLGLPDKKKGSTDKGVLENLPQVPFVKVLRKFRKTAKAYTTYVKPVLRWISPDGRVHSSYRLHGTPTGRLASRYPNLQNIPRLARLKGTFVSAPGYVLIANDLSQAELRSLATCSQDEALCQIYMDELDLHDEVATYRFGKDFTKEQRVRAKNINFGIIYGITKYGLAEQADIEPSEAQEDIDSWFSRFPKAKVFIDRCRASVSRWSIMITPFGRKKRPMPVGRDSFRARQNEAANFPHQSIASDITLLAAVSLLPILPIFGARIVNIVHDDIIVECPAIPDIVRDLARIVRRQLKTIPLKWGLDVIPFESDSEVGTRWGYTIKFAEKGQHNPQEILRAVEKSKLPIEEH